MFPTHNYSMNILELEADLYKSLNEYKEVFDGYIERYPLVDITPQNQDIVDSYYRGLRSLTEGMNLILKAFKELCSLKQVDINV
jgi:hypothetical protein